MKRMAIASILTLLSAAGAYAQQQAQCTGKDTPLSCWEKYNPTPASVAVATEETVAAANTGVSSVKSPSESAVKDFLSLLSASLESSTLTSNGQAVTFDYNPPIDVVGYSDALKLQAVFAKPQLNDKYVAALSTNAAALQTANDDLTNTDDVTLTAIFQPTGTTFGRSVDPHRPTFEAMIMALLPTDQLTAQNNAIFKAVNDGNLMAETQSFGTIDPAKQASVIAAFEAAARQQAAFRAPLNTFATTFAQLLNNQPQLYASGIYEARKNIVGPNTVSAKLTYEMGPRNLNGFRHKYGSACNELAVTGSTATASKCAGLLQTYAGTGTLPDDRLVFSLEYARSNQRWISDPTLNVAFGYPRSKSLIFNLTYGRTLMGEATGTMNGRIDLTFEYEDVTDDGDPTKNVDGRSLGSLTYTQKINDTFSLPVSLVYASDPSDLSSTDRKLNAHFGIVYKLPTGN